MNSLDFSIVLQAWPYLWSGLLFSLALTAVAFVVGMILGTCFALLQQFEVPVIGKIVRGYIALIRSIPLILVLFWFFFLVPIVLGHLAGNGRPIPIGATWTAFITFGLFEAAYYSEIIRVGLRAVNRGQFEACQALALSTFETYSERDPAAGAPRGQPDHPEPDHHPVPGHLAGLRAFAD
ncbi:His/Glu/Gln/Arg/opine family amino acid ABC transporter permease subunit [Bradyrhizobium sp. LM2.7]